MAIEIILSIIKRNEKRGPLSALQGVAVPSSRQNVTKCFQRVALSMRVVPLVSHGACGASLRLPKEKKCETRVLR